MGLVPCISSPSANWSRLELIRAWLSALVAAWQVVQRQSTRHDMAVTLTLLSHPREPAGVGSCDNTCYDHERTGLQAVACRLSCVDFAFGIFFICSMALMKLMCS